MKTLRHWTPRYVYSRVRQIAYERLHPDDPWLTPTAIDIVAEWLRPDDRGVEWGSGRSTLWLAPRVGHLTSIEHNAAWHAQVKIRLAEGGHDHVDHHHAEVPQTNSPHADHGYIQIAAALPDASLDFALVDGVLRDHCAELALRLLRPGALLIIDNANAYLPHDSAIPGARGADAAPKSEVWDRVNATLAGWRRIWTTNGVWDTAFFVKPAA